MQLYTRMRARTHTHTHTHTHTMYIHTYTLYFSNPKSFSGTGYETHSFIPLACAECDDSLPLSGASSISLCYVLFPATLLHQLFFYPLSSHLAIYFLVYLSIVVPKFIYNTLLGILFSSILCTCPNQRNLFNLIVSIIAGFLTLV